MELTTLEALKPYLGREEVGGEEAGETPDSVLTEQIKAASSLITNFARREFLPASGTREFAHDGGTFLDLDPFDLRTLESITVGGTELDEGLYALRPKPSKDGVYQWITLASDPGECEVSIAGVWGFAEIPADIQGWTNFTVAEWLRGGVFAYTPELGAAPNASGRSLPSAVQLGIEDIYRRPVVW